MAPVEDERPLGKAPLAVPLDQPIEITRPDHFIDRPAVSLGAMDGVQVGDRGGAIVAVELHEQVPHLVMGHEIGRRPAAAPTGDQRARRRLVYAVVQHRVGSEERGEKLEITPVDRAGIEIGQLGDRLLVEQFLDLVLQDHGTRCSFVGTVVDRSVSMKRSVSSMISFTASSDTNVSVCTAFAVR